MTTIEYPNQLTTPEDWAERQPEYQSDISNRFSTNNDEENGDVAHLLSEWERVGEGVDLVVRAIYDEKQAADTPYLLELETENDVEYEYRAKTAIEARQQVETMCFSINHLESNRTIEVDRMHEALTEVKENSEEIEVVEA